MTCHHGQARACVQVFKMRAAQSWETNNIGEQDKLAWIPAFAGMTYRLRRSWIALSCIQRGQASPVTPAKAGVHLVMTHHLEPSFCWDDGIRIPQAVS